MLSRSCRTKVIYYLTFLNNYSVKCKRIVCFRSVRSHTKYECCVKLSLIGAKSRVIGGIDPQWHNLSRPDVDDRLPRTLPVWPMTETEGVGDRQTDPEVKKPRS